jgi:hypothetical protein
MRDRPNPPVVHVVLDEAVLLRTAGDPRTMRVQLEHLVEIAGSTTTTIQVLPFNAGAYPLSGPFVILSFADPQDDDVVYLESILQERILEMPGEVSPYRSVFDGLCEKALDPAESLSLVKRVADEID